MAYSLLCTVVLLSFAFTLFRWITQSDGDRGVWLVALASVTFTPRKTRPAARADAPPDTVIVMVLWLSGHIAAHITCYGCYGCYGPNMLWAAMREPSRIHGVMAREATPNCSPLEFSLRALPRASGSASTAKYFLFCP